MTKESKQKVYQEYKVSPEENENVQQIDNDIWIG